MTESTRTSTAPTTGQARRQSHPGLLLLLIAGAQLMVVLDATIVNIALPSMGHYFHKDQTQMTWALNAYTLTFGGLLLLGGRAADILGRRQMFVLGLGLFSLGSFLGGIATSFPMLLAGRVVQGVGGAIAAPTSLSLITNSFGEGKERNRAFAVYAGVSGAGAAIGLLAGGILTEYLTWRWVLFVNVPIGVVLCIGGYLYIQSSERLKGKFDIVGGLLSVAGMVSLVYGFIHAASAGWSDPVTMTTLERRRGAARRLRRLRDAQPDRDDADADLRQPQPLRLVPGHAVVRRGDVRDVLLPDLLRPGRDGLQRAQGRLRVPAVLLHHHRRLRGDQPDSAAHRPEDPDRHRHRAGHGRAVLVRHCQLPTPATGPSCCRSCA